MKQVEYKGKTIIHMWRGFWYCAPFRATSLKKMKAFIDSGRFEERKEEFLEYGVKNWHRIGSKE